MACDIRNHSSMTGIEKVAENLYKFAQKQLGFEKSARVVFESQGDRAVDLFSPTGNYNPETRTITIFVDHRHPKDILRSMAHELIHHSQCCMGAFDGQVNTSPGYAQKDDRMRDFEKDAYFRGNVILFRDWEDNHKQKRSWNLMNENKNMSINEQKLRRKIRRLLTEHWLILTEESPVVRSAREAAQRAALRAGFSPGQQGEAQRRGDEPRGEPVPVVEPDPFPEETQQELAGVTHSGAEDVADLGDVTNAAGDVIPEGKAVYDRDDDVRTKKKLVPDDSFLSRDQVANIAALLDPDTGIDMAIKRSRADDDEPPEGEERTVTVQEGEELEEQETPRDPTSPRGAKQHAAFTQTPEYADLAKSTGRSPGDIETDRAKAAARVRTAAPQGVEQTGQATSQGRRLQARASLEEQEKPLKEWYNDTLHEALLKKFKIKK